MIVFINGSINSGKSTAAKLLQKELGNTANVEMDSLHEYIDWMPIDEAVPLNLKNGLAVIKNFVEAGINVVVPYPLSQRNYEYVKQELSSINVALFFVTLAPKLEKALEDRGGRKLTVWETKRIKHHYKIGISNPKFGVIIDNSDLTPTQTLTKILEVIKK